MLLRQMLQTYFKKRENMMVDKGMICGNLIDTKDALLGPEEGLVLISPPHPQPTHYLDK